VSSAESALMAFLDGAGIEGNARNALLDLLSAAEQGAAEVVSPRGIVTSNEQIWRFDLAGRLEDIRSGKEGAVNENTQIGVGVARQVVQDVMSGRGQQAVREITAAIAAVEKIND